jgi:hypothetical protein
MKKRKHEKNRNMKKSASLVFVVLGDRTNNSKKRRPSTPKHRSTGADGKWTNGGTARDGHGLIGGRQGAAVDSLKLRPGLPCPILLRPCGQATPERPYNRFRGSLPTGGRLAAVFYPFGHPTPCAYAPK